MLWLHKSLIGAVILLAVSMASSAWAKPPAGTDSATARFKVGWKEGRLSVKADQSSLSQVLREIAKWTGLEIRGSVDANRKVSATFSDVSLRDGLCQLLGPINYALLEKGSSAGGGTPAPFALVILPQRVAASTRVKSKPEPAKTASNNDAAKSNKNQAPAQDNGGMQPKDNQTAAATTPDDSEQSDCVVCQAGGRVAHKVHSLWDGGKNPGCGLVDNSPLLHAGVWHGDLHKVSVLIIALSITISLRMTATRATFLVLPRASSRS
jgi:hypothetical protein